MADKTVEFQCLEKVLAAPRPNGVTAKEVYTLLDNAQLISGAKQECPDFIFRHNDIIIGLEHFLVDVLTNESGSNARRVSKKRQQELRGRKPSHQLMKRINNSPAVQKQIQNGIATFNEFQFLREFQRVASKHGDSAAGYRATIQQHKAKHYIMGAMIEMPCQTNGKFVLYDSVGKHKERTLNCVPLTQNLISIMKRTLKEFDFVVILAETLLNEQPCDAKVYCFWHNNFEDAICEQRIPICTSFKIRLEGN
jgi:hypothetical protein